MILCVWALACSLALQAETGNLRWPLGSGAKAYPLRATYGQFEGSAEERGDYHYGIDIIAGLAGEKVYAIESGTVVRKQLHGSDSGTGGDCTVLGPKGSDGVDLERCGLLIESDSIPGRHFLYLHLEERTIQFSPGDHVAVGDRIGDVLYKDTITKVEHLHLSRVAGIDPATCWAAIEEHSVENPLKLLTPLEDTVAPEFLLLTKTMRRFRTNDYNDDEPDYLSIDSIHVGDALDLVVRAHDCDGSGSNHRLAPLRVELEIAAPGGVTETRALAFEGPLQNALDLRRASADFYNVDEKYHSTGLSPGRRYRYFFVPTNAGSGGSATQTMNAWVPTSVGKHEFRVRAFDVADNKAELSFDLDVKP
jgi:hypothetical protein